VDEIALYDMTGEGLSELPNASAALLAERRPGLPGSAVTASREGARSVLVEIQALVGGAAAGSPRRVAIGVDGGRLALLLAVLEGSGLALSSREVFVSCTGGLDVGEPAADLAIVAALVSSARARPLPDGSVFFGEIGLLGEVRRVPAAVSRLKEAAALGFGRVYLPAGNAGDAAGFPDLVCRPVDRVTAFLASLDDQR
jgi:DNA repair protein RadA/Sms